MSRVTRRSRVLIMGMVLSLGLSASASAQLAYTSPKVPIAAGNENMGSASVAFGDGRFLTYSPDLPSQLVDVVSGTVTNTGRSHVHPQGTGVALADGRVLLVGGSNDPQSADIYDPASNTWTAAARMPQRDVDGASSVLLQDGRVLVVGGVPDANSASLYDPRTNTWTSAGTTTKPRVGAGVTQLKGGKVLVAGGANSTQTAETFDPASGTWAATGALPFPVSDGAAVTLSFNVGMLLGGGGATSITPAMYHPATNAWTAGPVATAYGTSTVRLQPAEAVIAGNGDVVTLLGGRVQRYQPDQKVWFTSSQCACFKTSGIADNQPGPIYDGNLSLLPDGRVGLLGSFDGRANQSEGVAIALTNPGSAPSVGSSAPHASPERLAAHNGQVTVRAAAGRYKAGTTVRYRIVGRGRLLAGGDATVHGHAAFSARLTVTRLGQRELRARRPLRATLVTRGIDAAGKHVRNRRKVVLTG